MITFNQAGTFDRSTGQYKQIQVDPADIVVLTADSDRRCVVWRHGQDSGNYHAIEIAGLSISDTSVLENEGLVNISLFTWVDPRHIGSAVLNQIVEG